MVNLGILLACGAALFLEVLATRVLGIVIGPEAVYYTVAIAMLGMGAAASFVAVCKPVDDFARARRIACRWSVLAAIATVAVFVAGRLLSEAMNRIADEAVVRGGLSALVSALSRHRLGIAFAMGAVLALPAFCHGMVLSTLFRAARPSARGRLYGFDLIGAASGCVLAIVALEYGGFGMPLAFAVATPIIAAAAFATTRSWVFVLAGAAVAGALSFEPIATPLEPRPQLRRLAKMWDEKGHVDELWHTWNSYTRVAALRVKPEGAAEPYEVLAVGIGEGHAIIRPYGARDPQPRAGRIPVELASVACDPSRILVLFAGVGRDLMALRELHPNAALVGVELNRQLLDWAVDHADAGIDEFLSQDGVRLEVAEARAFLECDESRYDSILMSWSGANVSYYTGAAGYAARFAYTLESLETMQRRLAPGGQITILNTNKLKVLSALEEIRKRAGGRPLGECVVILEDGTFAMSDWRRPWNENRLVYKPDGFTRGDLDRVRSLAQRWDLEIRYSPDLVGDPGDPYYRVLRAVDPARELAILGPRHMVSFAPATDDRPFVLDLFPPRAWLAREFLSGTFRKRGPSPAVWLWDARREQLKGVFWLAIAAAVLILGPVILRGRGSLRTVSPVRVVSYFTALGAGYMLVQVGLVQKLALFFGHPGVTLGLVMGSMILFSGLGSLASTRMFAGRSWTVRRCAVAIAVTGGVLLAGIEWWKSELLVMDELPRMIVVFLALGPVGFLMGQPFPRGIASMGEREAAAVPWALAVNGCAGTVAAGLGIPLAFALGYRVVVLTGLLAYVLVALLRGPGTEATAARP